MKKYEERDVKRIDALRRSIIDICTQESSDISAVAIEAVYCTIIAHYYHYSETPKPSLDVFLIQIFERIKPEIKRIIKFIEEKEEEIKDEIF
jgi:predicted phosphatase